MNKLVRYMRYACFALVLLLTACFKDGLQRCSTGEPAYSYIKFIYERNLQDEDLFHKQVNKMYVYLFDEDGVFIDRLVDQVADENKMFPKNYSMGVPERVKHASQFVALAGVNEGQTNVPNMTTDVSTIADLYVTLSGASSTFVVDQSIPPFFHGIELVGSKPIEENDTTRINLTKNTNSIRIVLQVIDGEGENEDLNTNDFSISLTAFNGKYDYNNNAVGQDSWDYRPYYYAKNSETGSLVAELSTMRLFEDRENRLVIKQLQVNEPLLDVNLNSYIAQLKPAKYEPMSLQEYMDRQDEYAIIILLKKSEDDGRRWKSAGIKINSWNPIEQPVVIE